MVSNLYLVQPKKSRSAKIKIVVFGCDCIHSSNLNSPQLLFVCVAQHCHNLSIMPPKRKESAATPVASGPKQKRSKISFRTPTTAALEGTTTSAASDVGSTSTKNQVVTLRASASGRRGYHSQDLSTTQSSSVASDSLAAENSAITSDTLGDLADRCEPIPALNIESDTQPSSGGKSRPKQRNTTTVGYIG